MSLHLCIICRYTRYIFIHIYIYIYTCTYPPDICLANLQQMTDFVLCVTKSLGLICFAELDLDTCSSATICTANLVIWTLLGFYQFYWKAYFEECRTDARQMHMDAYWYIRMHDGCMTDAHRFVRLHTNAYSYI